MHGGRPKPQTRKMHSHIRPTPACPPRGSRDQTRPRYTIHDTGSARPRIHGQIPNPNLQLPTSNSAPYILTCMHNKVQLSSRGTPKLREPRPPSYMCRCVPDLPLLPRPGCLPACLLACLLAVSLSLSMRRGRAGRRVTYVCGDVVVVSTSSYTADLRPQDLRTLAICVLKFAVCGVRHVIARTGRVLISLCCSSLELERRNGIPRSSSSSLVSRDQGRRYRRLGCSLAGANDESDISGFRGVLRPGAESRRRAVVLCFSLPGPTLILACWHDGKALPSAGGRTWGASSERSNPLPVPAAAHPLLERWNAGVRDLAS
ncbi:hypothetical protein OH76DRAFT_656249 [Lentinus brumalis]|uniref:Uncharacterized protein n=1 Tax=Lentinus brumalis TaxID=2498619 RepID=A0A371D7G3_9APHY|nr:hypothetical protein OH76DRAFT_656249 [Polyporus brumalis]